MTARNAAHAFRFISGLFERATHPNSAWPDIKEGQHLPGVHIDRLDLFPTIYYNAIRYRGTVYSRYPNPFLFPPHGAETRRDVGLGAV